MSWAFAHLGLTADADARGVKRAYAKLLSKTRPDEDPAGFQRLHEAYKIALALSQNRTVRPVAPGTAPATAPLDANTITASAVPSSRTPQAAHQQAFPARAPSSAPVPDVSAAQPPTDPATLANQVIQHAVDTDDEKALGWWLSTQQDFWSIRRKQQTGQLMLERLFRDPQPMSPRCLDAMLQFFDLAQVSSGVRALALQQLRQQQTARWNLQERNLASLARHLKLYKRGGRPDTARIAADLSVLKAPLTWRDVMMRALMNGRTTTMFRLIRALCEGRTESLPPEINRDHARFWWTAVQTGVMSGPRFAIGSIRALGLALLCLILMFCIMSLSVYANGMGDAISGRLYIATSFAAVIPGLWLVSAGWLWLDGWQGLAESSPVRRPWFRRGLIPALCAVSLVMDYLAGLAVVATCVILPTLILAIRRYVHRSRPKPGKFHLWQVARAWPGAALLMFLIVAAGARSLPSILPENIPLVTLGASLALLTWIADLWRFRALFRSSAKAKT